MRFLRRASLLLLAPLVLGCRPSRPVAATPRCPPTWSAQFSPDSSIAICAPTAFRSEASSGAGSGRWYRAHGTTPVGEWLAIRVEARDAVEPTDPWPIRLASGTGCLADCTRVDSLTVRQDSLTGVLAHVETARVTGGVSGMAGQPLLVASWTPTPETRAHAWGLAESGAMLDTLRQILRTATLAPPTP